MMEVAERLACGIPFVRVDLFSEDDRVIFGEMTFFPGNGMILFYPPHFDREFGDHLELPAANYGHTR